MRLIQAASAAWIREKTSNKSSRICRDKAVGIRVAQGSRSREGQILRDGLPPLFQRENGLRLRKRRQRTRMSRVYNHNGTCLYFRVAPDLQVTRGLCTNHIQWQRAADSCLPSCRALLPIFEPFAIDIGRKYICLAVP